MQCKKDEINQKIKEIALDEFYRVGFRNANVRDIAKGCHITVGNIYRYYPSKAGLLEVLLEPVYEEIRQFTINSEDFIEALENKKAGEIVYNFLRDFLLQNSKKILILINKCDGSKYENTKKQVIEAVSNSLSKAYHADIEVTKLYANLIISGVSAVLVEYMDSPKVVDYYCTKILPLIFRTVKEVNV